MVGYTCFHRWCHSDRLVNAAKIVVHEVKGDRVLVVLNLFRETIREPGESTHAHAHRKILAFYKTR
jgi:hypothetical protein